MESSKAAVISIGKMSKRLKHQLLEFDSNEKEFCHVLSCSIKSYIAMNMHTTVTFYVAAKFKFRAICFKNPGP